MPLEKSLFSEYLQHPNSFVFIALVFAALAIGHAIADYPLQGEYLARTKSPTGRDASLGEGAHDWIISLNAHCMIHAGVVWLITGSIFYALLEWILHWIIDYLKVRKITSLLIDQVLHFSCKLVYAVCLIEVF